MFWRRKKDRGEQDSEQGKERARGRQSVTQSQRVRELFAGRV